jgi:hypothetical protein
MGRYGMAHVMAKASTPPGGQKPGHSAPARRMAERPRGGEARAIADLVQSVGDTSFRKFGFVQSAIVTRWPEIVGRRLARVTTPESLRFPRGKKADGTLHIAVAGANAVIVQHVLPDLIARVNQFFGYAAVARIQLVQGRAEYAPAPTTPTPAMRPVPPSSTPISPSLNAIADPELRAVLEGLAGSLSARPPVGKIS